MVVVDAVSGGAHSPFLFTISFCYRVIGVAIAAAPSGCRVLMSIALSTACHREGVVVFVFHKLGVYVAAIMWWMCVCGSFVWTEVEKATMAPNHGSCL